MKKKKGTTKKKKNRQDFDISQKRTGQPANALFALGLKLSAYSL